MTLSIIQWRIPGDDEDNLDCVVIPDGYNHEQNIIDLHGDPSVERDDENDVAPIYFTNTFTFEDGEIVEGIDKKQYRIRIEEVV